MDIPLAVLALLFACAGYVCFVARGRANCSSFINEMLHRVEAGICPRCESVHPEASKHSGPNDFWTRFQCPDCGHSIQAHASKHPPP